MGKLGNGSGRRAMSRLLALLTCAIAALGCAGAASAAPGLTPLGKPQIGLPTDSQEGGAVTLHHGEVYAAEIQFGPRAAPSLRVHWFDRAREAWLPVGGQLNSAGDGPMGFPQLLSTRHGELYAGWVEHVGGAHARAIVARFEDGNWVRVLDTPSTDQRLRLAQIGDEVWVGWTNQAARFARIEPHGWAHPVPLPDAFPPGRVRALVGYNGAGYAVVFEWIHEPAYVSEFGRHVPAQMYRRMRMVRLQPLPGAPDVRVSLLGTGDHVGEAFLAAGTPDAPTRPVLAWEKVGATATEEIQLARLRDDATGLELIPVRPLMILRDINQLHGLAVTPAGITIAAGREGPEDQRVRVFTIAGPPDERTITDGDELAGAAVGVPVEMAALPAPAAPGTLVLTYATMRGHGGLFRLAPMRYTP